MWRKRTYGDQIAAALSLRSRRRAAPIWSRKQRSGVMEDEGDSRMRPNGRARLLLPFPSEGDANATATAADDHSAFLPPPPMEVVAGMRSLPCGFVGLGRCCIRVGGGESRGGVLPRCGPELGKCGIRETIWGNIDKRVPC